MATIGFLMDMHAIMMTNMLDCMALSNTMMLFLDNFFPK